jgi:hypothetical protein
MKTNLTLILVAGILLNGCVSFGPNTVQNDRMGYVTAISESLKTQMLLNLVKLRYGDLPIFLDVSSVINQYGLEGQVSLAHNWPGNEVLTDNSVAATGRYYDRPTITYSPMTGDKFTRSLMTPIPPGVVLNFIQSGKSSDFMLRLCVQSINGIQNQGATKPADPCFVKLIDLLGELHEIGGVVLKFGDGKNKGITYLVITQPEEPKASAPRAEIRKMLKLKPDATEVTGVYGGSPSSDTEVAMVTRSVFDIMVQVALSAEVPQTDIDDGRAYPSSPLLRDPAYKPLARIHSGKSRPKDAAVMVRYRDLWFWLEDKDLQSKRAFSALLLMINLAESGQPAAAPLVTIPAG